ncbi:hypothetical protein FGB62_10g03 [Gracilaria domingensis]|nr:hypothetical protein FGB62_10g03 [Gracilaria domingensis]
MRAYRIIEVIFDTAAIISVAVPTVVSVISFAARFVSARRGVQEDTAVNAVGVAAGLGGPTITIFVRRHVLSENVVDDVKEDAVDYLQDQLDDYLPFLDESDTESEED